MVLACRQYVFDYGFSRTASEIQSGGPAVGYSRRGWIGIGSALMVRMKSLLLLTDGCKNRRNAKGIVRAPI